MGSGSGGNLGKSRVYLRDDMNAGFVVFWSMDYLVFGSTVGMVEQDT